MTTHGCERQDRLERRDYLLLTGFSLILFGMSMVTGRPLSIHEAVLPQTAREMYVDGDWVVPKRGGAPWMESPPLPQWVTVSIGSIFGGCDETWVVRLGPTLVGTAIVCMVAWMAALWFGRTIGVLSGLIMATTCQFTRYAWLAEDEIYLCGIVTAAVALFVRLEFAEERDVGETPPRGMLRGFFGGRNAAVFVFFVVLGMTNLAKGLIFGTAMALIPIAGFLLWNADVRRIGRYFWFWGWLTFAAVMLAWPLAAYLRYPGVLDVWKFDLGGRLDGSYQANAEAFWYYPVNLLWILAPWTFVVPFGVWITRRQALFSRYSPERFLWCWAVLVPLVFSFSHGKHHHYLLHAITPWAILSAHGLLQVRARMRAWPPLMHNPLMSVLTTALPIMVAVWLLRAKIPGPSAYVTGLLILCPILTVAVSWAVMHRNPRIAAGTVFGMLLVAYSFGLWFAGQHVDRHRFDARFLQAVRKQVPRQTPVLVDMDHEALRGFFSLFHLGDNAIPLHNLSYARDARINEREVYVITRYRKQSELDELGSTTFVMRSEQTGGESSPEDRWSLFRLKFDPNVDRISSSDIRITPMQAMFRAPGPVLR